jgi:uncharacterized protein YigE (DUF2233 family)
MRLCVSALLFLLLVGCTAVSNTPPTPILPSSSPAIATPTPFVTVPTETAVPQLATAQPTRIPDTGWEALHPGFERRIVHLFDEDGRTLEQLYILRIDPALYEFQVNYRPGEPQMLQEWLAQTEALAVVNGGFFTEEYVATGLIIVDGQASGASYGDFAGMFAVANDVPQVRWLGERPYSPDEPIQHALQSFPMLVKPGGVEGYAEDDGLPNRRTVVGMDGNGRILILVTPWGYFTLYSLSQYLLQSDLNLDVALNLDGGTSSGLILANPDEQISGYVPIPAIISIYSR